MIEDFSNKATLKIDDVFAEVVNREFESIPKSEGNQIYSVKFLKKMNKLLKDERKFYFRMVNSAVKRVAVVIITMLVIGCATLSIGAVRRAVAGFFTDIYESFTRLTVADDQYDNLKTIIEEVYTLGEVPEGYVLAYESRGIGSNVYQWYNNGEQIELFQMAAAVGSSTIDAEDNPYQELYVGDFEGLYLVDENYRWIAWVYDGYLFEITCPLSITESELINMAKSIKIQMEY